MYDGAVTRIKKRKKVRKKKTNIKHEKNSHASSYPKDSFSCHTTPADTQVLVALPVSLLPNAMFLLIVTTFATQQKYLPVAASNRQRIDKCIY